jgi:hypothetical protein
VFVSLSASTIFQNTERIAIQFGESTRTIEARIKVDLRQQIDCENANWIYLSLDENWCRFLANTEMKDLLLRKEGQFSSTSKEFSFQKSR